MARKFFYLCAGLLMLAISYQMGVTKATAQGSSVGFYAAVSRGHVAVIVYPNGDVNYWDHGWHTGVNVFGGTPAGRTIVQLDGGELGPVAVASTGEVFYGEDYSLGPWTNYGVPPGGVTGAVQTSWGALKAKSR